MDSQSVRLIAWVPLMGGNARERLELLRFVPRFAEIQKLFLLNFAMTGILQISVNVILLVREMSLDGTVREEIYLLHLFALLFAEMEFL